MAKALPIYAVNPTGLLAENVPLMLHTRLAEMYQFAPYIADPLRVDELHNMRIAAKRLRYTLEIFAACFPDAEYRKIYDPVKSIQEKIGDIHDIDVRIPLLTEFLHTHAGKRPETRVGLETLIRTQHTKRAELYRNFLSYWNKHQKQGFKRQFLQLLLTIDSQFVEGKASLNE
jgi:CHAD domain-containing protein